MWKSVTGQTRGRRVKGKRLKQECLKASGESAGGPGLQAWAEGRKDGKPLYVTGEEEKENGHKYKNEPSSSAR